MQQLALINVVGLSSSLLTNKDLFITQWIEKRKLSLIKPVLPAVTCAAQSTYLTGQWPSEHGIVANGWYFREECEVKLWRQSNHLVEAPKIWDLAKERDPAFTCSNMFWWYNMYSNADFNVTPRPQYRADGQKIPDCYSHPPELRDRLQVELGQFPLFSFWGPRTSIKSSDWIAKATMLVHDWHEPTLQLVYLPHMDYVLQKRPAGSPDIEKDLRELDNVLKSLIQFYEKKGVEPILISEYGVNPVEKAFPINRVLRKAGYIQVRVENGKELLDAGASQAFAMADHQIAHVYINEKDKLAEIKALLESYPEIALVLDEEGKKAHHIDHHRAGDLVIMAKASYWFNYYYWLDDSRAPDFARMVDIHNKPGYDPVEMFTDPKKKFMIGRIVWKLIKKKLGFRTLMDVIPLDDSLVKGSHGCIDVDKKYYPIFVGQQEQPELQAIDVCDIVLNRIFPSES